MIKTSTVPLHSCLKKVKSHESVFRNHKSFAEEIAEALLMRARNIANSHPTVVVGKEKRFAEGLINVAEALKSSQLAKSVADAKQHSTIPKPIGLTINQKNMTEDNTTEAKCAPKLSPARVEGLHCKNMILAIDATSPLKTSHIGDKGRKSSFERSWTAVFKEEGVVTTTMTIEKSTFVPLNLPFGKRTSDAGDINITGPFVRTANSRPARNFPSTLEPNGCFRNYSTMSRRFSTCSSFGDMEWDDTFRCSDKSFASGGGTNLAVRRTRNLKQATAKRSYSKDSFSKRLEEAFCDTAWSKDRDKDSLKSRRSLTDRIQTFMRKNNFKSFKQRMRNACSNRMRGAGDTIGRIRDCVVATLKK